MRRVLCLPSSVCLCPCKCVIKNTMPLFFLQGFVERPAHASLLMLSLYLSSTQARRSNMMGLCIILHCVKTFSFDINVALTASVAPLQAFALPVPLAPPWWDAPLHNNHHLFMRWLLVIYANCRAAGARCQFLIDWHPWTCIKSEGVGGLYAVVESGVAS